ncbi:prolipoprotein diacylglyceryl transferase family protein [Stagnihabitans tardus]|uniref:Diacylglyceryl transferase n=1 Tax=Stagnihabitans tardus TaxID=2699202 RepID=A0AAE4YHT5_9RHOB|nr:prolipoprotein diacylglyceryl transferase family protein [Stagnihabitans tardus]NBZ90090.1 diacylglyceryl transferase [Stagnihabitans tardus]
MGVHLVFDLLSVVVAGVGTFLWTRAEPGPSRPGPGSGPGGPGPRPGEANLGREAPTAPLEARLGPVGREGYLTALSLGILLGSYILGTAILWLSGVPAIGRSILGALTGGIIAVETYKRLNGIKGSTGGLFVPTFCLLVIVGRIGCALSGLEDNTYGIPTTLPWGVDFGDGIPRHPVAAYESLAMLAFLLAALAWRKTPLFAAHGFHLMVGFYAAQRFGLEFLKPYAGILGPMNLFHMTCAGLLAYALVMVRK